MTGLPTWGDEKHTRCYIAVASTVLVLAVGEFKSFVLISDQNASPQLLYKYRRINLNLRLLPFVRINKKGSQKDAEQKKNGNYFFYDDGVDNDTDVDEDDL